MLLEIPQRGHGSVRCVECGCYLAGESFRPGKALAGVFLERGLIVEGVNVADPAAHEKKDAVLGLAGQVLLAGAERVDGVRGG